MTVTGRPDTLRVMSTPGQRASPGPVYGLVLAAGAGSRFGGPKALALDEDGTPWLHRVVEALRAGGCDEVVVVLGADADRARQLVPVFASSVRALSWRDGLSASLRSGIDALLQTDAGTCIVSPVDVPTMPASVVARVIAAAGAPSSLARATYGAAPGHPVALGRDHWMPITASASGDVGAGPYLRAHGAVEVACDDLWDGADTDTR